MLVCARVVGGACWHRDRRWTEFANDERCVFACAYVYDHGHARACVCVCVCYTGLRAVLEITLHQAPELLDEFMEEFLALSMAPERQVRRWSAVAAASIGSSERAVAHLPRALEHVTALLQDNAKEVQKQAAISSLALVQRSLVVLREEGEDGGGGGTTTNRRKRKKGGIDKEALWNLTHTLISRAYAMTADDSTPGTVRLHLIKLVEQAALASTAPSTAMPWLSPDQREALAAESMMAIRQILPLLSLNAVSGPVSIVLMNALTNIARSREELYVDIATAFVDLAAKVGANANEAERDGDVQVASANHTIVGAMVQLIKCSSDSTSSVRDELVALLTEFFDAGDQADAAVRHAEKMAAKDSREGSRKRDRRSEEDDMGADEEAEKRRRRDGDVGDVPGVDEGPLDPEDEEREVIVQQNKAVVTALVKRNDMRALNSFVQNMQPEILAELVIHNLQFLPSTMPPSYVDEPKSAPVKVEPGVPTPLGGAPSSGPPQHAGGVRPRDPRVGKPVPKLAPLPMSEDDKAHMRSAAQERIIQASAAGSPAAPDSESESESVHLLARLVEMAPRDDNAEAKLLEHLFQDWKERDGHRIAIALLYRRFAISITAPSAAQAKAERGNGDEDMEDGDAAGNHLLAGQFEEYSKLLMRLLSGLKENLPWNDRALQILLKEAPLVSASAVAFLGASCAGKWSTLMLSTLRDIVTSAPSVRDEALRAILEAATSSEEEARKKAVRLVANILMPMENLQQLIVDFARDALTAVTSSAESKDIGEVAETATERDTIASDDAGGQTAVDADAAGGGGAGNEARPEPMKKKKGDTSAFDLFLALCTKQHALLRELARAYAVATPQQRQVVHVQLPGLIRAVSAESEVLHKVIAAPPEGAEAFALQALHAAAEACKEGEKPIPSALVVAARSLYTHMKNDGRALIPVLSAMSPADALASLPKLVVLQQAQWKSALTKLLQIVPKEDILVGLHSLETARDGVPLKKAIEAISECLNLQQMFTSEAIAVAIEKMVAMDPLPLLFMRTLIQCVNFHPGLKTFARGILAKLVRRQVWTMSPQVWKGFVHSLKQLSPGSFEVIQQLPVEKLDDVIKSAPELVKPFSEFMSAPARRVAVSRAFLAKIGLEGVEAMS